MSNTRQRLTTALLRLGQAKLAEIWGVDASEAGRRLNGQRNIPFDDFADALDSLGVQIVTSDQEMAIVPRDELEALRTLARKSLDKS